MTPTSRASGSIPATRSSTPLFYRRFIEPVEDRMIRSIWRITRNPQDAEDALQDALVTIWKNQDRFTNHQCPPALILKICFDAAYDVVRKQRRTGSSTKTDDSSQELIDPSPSPLDEILQREAVATVLTAIHQLSRCQATAIALRAFEDLSFDQIAAAMNCTAATARKHVERARGRLRGVLVKFSPDQIQRSSP